MIRTAITLDLTAHDVDADAHRRRVFAALGSRDDGTLIRLVVDREAFFDNLMSTIAAMTLDCDVEITGDNPQDVRQFARLFATFQRQRRNAEAGAIR